MKPEAHIKIFKLAKKKTKHVSFRRLVKLRPDFPTKLMQGPLL